MSGLPSEGPPLPGLRERKKARTRAAIQHEALRLFREKGYEETTVDQIAEAVEISPSTFFRYFGTKEDVVLTDDYDVVLVEQYRAQPPDLGPVQALRKDGPVRPRQPWGTRSSADMRERTELALSVPGTASRAARPVRPDDTPGHRAHRRTGAATRTTSAYARLLAPSWV